MKPLRSRPFSETMNLRNFGTGNLLRLGIKAERERSAHEGKLAVDCRRRSPLALTLLYVLSNLACADVARPHPTVYAKAWF